MWKCFPWKKLGLIWLSTTSICRENANSMSLILKIKNQKVKFLPFFTAERSVCFDFCIDAYALHCSAESTRPLITELMSWGLKPVKAWQALATEMNQFTHFRFLNRTLRNPDDPDRELDNWTYDSWTLRQLNFCTSEF